MRLLIVEDDRDLAEAMASAFARRDISSDRAEALGDAMLMLGMTHYAAVVLDIGLPDGNGLTLLKHLREQHDPIPVIVLTARSELAERIGGLDAGADDYLIKPFEFDELYARLKAVRRRQGGFPGNMVTAGNVQFDMVSQELLIAGELLPLSSRERQLLEMLLRRPGRVVAKRLVEDQLFGMSEMLGSNAIEVYIHRVRRKLERAGASIRIETIRGIGYMLRAVP